MNDLKRRLLEAYKKMYKNDPEEYRGAVKISREIGLTEKEYGSHHGKAHNYLKQLVKEGFLEHKRGSGFRYKFCNKRGTNPNNTIKKGSKMKWTEYHERKV